MARTAIVTGATKGIGAAIASKLRAEGNEVIGIARTVPKTFEGPFFECDLNDLEQAKSVFDAIALEHDVSILVNNVGAVAVESVPEITLEGLSRQWRVNVEASVLAVQAVLPAMKAARWGRIVNISSGAILGKSGRSGYAGSKAAILGMTRTMAMELGADGITVNCVAPGQIYTAMWAANNNPESPKTKAMIQSIPAQRLGTGDDVAGAVAYFASDAAQYVTGQTLFVCGGLTVGRNPI